MNNLYRFSPIKDAKTLEDALFYTAKELEKLSEKLIGEKLPIVSLKLFPHYPDEYDYLFSLISKIGPKSKYTSQTSFYVDVDRKVNEYQIKLLGLRIVDPYRMQVGCGDYEVDKFQEFRSRHVSLPFVRDIIKYPNMLEIWHPDFDVLGYIIPHLK